MPMNANICEGCSAAHPKSYGLWDYCLTCGKNLCPTCMATGCCGQVPAKSGMEAESEATLENEALAERERQENRDTRE